MNAEIRADAFRQATAVAANDLRVENLIMVRGTKAVVHGIKFRVASGQVTVMLGPNGAGKTSTVLGLSGLIEPVFGEVWLDGVESERPRCGRDPAPRNCDRSRRPPSATRAHSGGEFARGRR